MVAMFRRGTNRGSGGSRRNDPSIEDSQRQKDRSKLRVSFKTSHLPNKSDVKLRLDDVLRLNEDDDMMMSQDRPGSIVRRRGSPIPRPKNRQLMPNGLGWYQVTIIRKGRILEKETLLLSMQEAISPHVLIPKYWRSEESRVIFYTDDFQAAERLQQLRSHVKLSDGTLLNPLVSCGCPPVTINEELKAKMKLVMAKRYNVETKALDLSRFHADPDLRPIFCPLFHVNVMCVALDIICENIPDVGAINLNDNHINTMEAFKGAEKRLPHLKILYLGDNKISSLVNLFIFCHLPLVELVLSNNPCSSRFKNPMQLLRQIRRKFPKLMRLDGEALVNPESDILPTAKASFCATSTAQTFCDNSWINILISLIRVIDSHC